MAFEREKVLEREGKPARFFGMTLKEMITLIGLVFVTNVFTDNRMLLIGVLGGYLAWIKKIRDFVPERYFTRMFKFYWLPNHTFRAGTRHAEWRSPIRPEPPQ